MASWQSETWEPALESGLPARDRLSGPFASYVPDPLGCRPLVVGPQLSRDIADVERAARALSDGPGGADLEGLSRFLLRSEAIASSLIEGIAPSAANVAVAELAQQEQVRNVSDSARLVANNITIVRRATEELVSAAEVTVDDVVRLQSALIPEERHHGIRLVQNWIGGSNWHPLAAQFVPPSPDRVDALMADLVEYLNGSAHSPIVQAALTHAQFETIHPFTDGNGRVGRALVHTVLARRGTTRSAVLPISLVLSTLRDRYVDGLTAYRHEGPVSSAVAVDGTEAWLRVFTAAAAVAVEQADRLVGEVTALRGEWAERLAGHRASAGLREVPRAGSASARLLTALPEAPVVTARTVQRVLGVSFPAARAAVEELADAGILRRRQIERGTTAYLATDVLSLVDQAERQLASTAFDTRVSPPNRPVPVRPAQLL
jgi:Fic family protein